MCYKQVLHCSVHDQFYTCRKTLQIDIHVESCTNQKAVACAKMKVSTCVYIRHLKTIEKLVFLQFIFYVHKVLSVSEPLVKYRSSNLKPKGQWEYQCHPYTESLGRG